MWYKINQVHFHLPQGRLAILEGNGILKPEYNNEISQYYVWIFQMAKSYPHYIAKPVKHMFILINASFWQMAAIPMILFWDITTDPQTAQIPHAMSI